MKWRRKLFFIFEALKITPQERRAVALLILLLTIVGTLNKFLEPRPAANKDRYAALEAEFRRRTAELHREEAELMKRYYPGRADTAKELSAAGTADPLIRGAEQENMPDRININAAGLQQLQEIPGIGPVYARRIIDHRNEYGSFNSVSDLLNIKGIGRKRLEKMKPFIKLKG